MHVRLYCDEDSMDKALIKALRAQGIDVITALESDMIEQSDEKHLSFATAQGRVLYSSNISDFCRLHQAWCTEGRSHAGMVFPLQQRYTVGDRVRRLLNLMGQMSAEDMKNRVEFLSNWG